MQNLIDHYEELLILKDPLTEILNKGNLNEFLVWFNNWKPETLKEEHKLNNLINTILISKLIDYEYYDWIKYLKCF